MQRRQYPLIAVVTISLASTFFYAPMSEAQQDSELAKALLNRGTEAASVGNMAGTVESWSKALKVMQGMQNTDIITLTQGRCHANIGIALAYMRKYTEAESNFTKALSLYQSIQTIDTEQDKAACHVTIGSVAINMGKYEEAKAYYQKALKVYQAASGMEREQADCYMGIGTALLNMKEYQEAKANYHYALGLYQNIEDTEQEQMGIQDALSLMEKPQKVNEGIGIFRYLF